MHASQCLEGAVSLRSTRNLPYAGNLLLVHQQMIENKTSEKPKYEVGQTFDRSRV